MEPAAYFHSYYTNSQSISSLSSEELRLFHFILDLELELELDFLLVLELFVFFIVMGRVKHTNEGWV